MSDSRDPIRKAAVLIASLDRRSADALLEQMGENQAARVRHAVIELGEVSPSEQNQVIEGFLRIRPMVPSDEHSGIELDGSLARRIAAAEIDNSPSLPDATQVDDSSPFRFLHEAEGETLAPFLEREHPQTISVVLAHLSPRQAAEVLTRLPSALQTEVIQRVVDLDDTDPEIVREIEDQLHSLLADSVHSHKRRAASITAMRAILKAAGQVDRKCMLANLAGSNRSLAEQFYSSEEQVKGTGRLADPNIRGTAAPLHASSKRSLNIQRDGDGEVVKKLGQAPHGNTKSRGNSQSVRSQSHSFTTAEPSRPEKTAPLPNRSSHDESLVDSLDAPPGGQRTSPTDGQQMVSLGFDDLAQLDNQALGAVLREADPETAMLALTAASPSLIDRIMKQLTAKQAEALRQRIEHPGPVRIQDLEQAQQELARVATNLVSRGKIQAEPSPRFAAAG